MKQTNKKAYSIDCPNSIVSILESFSTSSMLSVSKIIVLAAKYQLKRLENSEIEIDRKLSYEKKSTKKISISITDGELISDFEDYVKRNKVSKTLFFITSILEFINDYKVYFLRFGSIVVASNDSYQNIALVKTEMFVHFFNEEDLNKIRIYQYKPHLGHDALTRVKRLDLIDLFEKKIILSFQKDNKFDKLAIF